MVTTPPPPTAPSLLASIVVPAFEDARRIGATVEALAQALAELAGDQGSEVVVVDDGSRDGTADAALAAGADQVLVLPANRGKGAAVRAGVLAARGRTIAFTDSDLAYSPVDVVRALAAAEREWDVVIGNRRSGGAPRSAGSQPRLRRLGSRVINRLAAVALLSRPADTQCGLKAFRAGAARTLFGLSRIDGFAFDIELLHLVEKHGFSLGEVPVTAGSTDRTTVRFVRDTLRLVADLGRIRRLDRRGESELRTGGPSSGDH